MYQQKFIRNTHSHNNQYFTKKVKTVWNCTEISKSRFVRLDVVLHIIKKERLSTHTCLKSMLNFHFILIKNILLYVHIHSYFWDDSKVYYFFKKAFNIYGILCMTFRYNDLVHIICGYLVFFHIITLWWVNKLIIIKEWYNFTNKILSNSGHIYKYLVLFWHRKLLHPLQVVYIWCILYDDAYICNWSIFLYYTKFELISQF